MNDAHPNSADPNSADPNRGSDLGPLIETAVPAAEIDSSTFVEESRHGEMHTSTPIEPSRAAASAAQDRNDLRRAWDDYDAYLFDIDGTLLHCRDAVHYFAFCDVLTRTAGRPVNLDGVPVQGKIDPGILRDAFSRADVPESTWHPLLPQLLDRMGQYVEEHAAEFDIEVLPGVRGVLQHLQGRGRLLGVGTGNLQRIGWSKLSHCGLRNFFTLGGFSDRYEQRGDMIAGAAAMAREQLSDPNAAVLVLGDTPGDIAAARFAEVDVIAVATGIYPAADLQDADLVIGSMLELRLPAA